MDYSLEKLSSTQSPGDNFFGIKSTLDIYWVLGVKIETECFGMFKQKSFKTAEVSIIVTLPEVNEAAKGAGGRPVFHIFWHVLDSLLLLALNLPMFGHAK